MAGYDPNAALSFWQRMAASNTNQTSEFLSDHPSDATRIKNIQGWLPEALKYYKPQSTAKAVTTTKKTTTTTKKSTTSTKKAVTTTKKTK
jgi:predicted Zn-dependent protease